MIFRQLFDPQSSTYTYLLACPATREAVLVDPVFEHARRDTALIQELGFRLLLQCARQDRQNRGDARASCKTDAVQRARALRDKATLGCHHAQRVTRLELGGRPIGKHPALNRTDAYFQFIVGVQMMPC